MVIDVAATLGLDGRIADWQYAMLTPSQPVRR